MTKIDLRFCHKILPNGMPEGYEFVRVGFAKQGELYLGSGDDNVKVIVRKIEPPKPKYIPWTYETCPVGSVVVNKTDDYKALVISAGLSSACFGVSDASYANLLDQYTQLDGMPCGTVEP